MLPIRTLKNAVNRLTGSGEVTWVVEVEFEKIPWEGIEGEPEYLTEVVEIEAKAQPDEDWSQIEGFEEKVEAAFNQRFGPAHKIRGNYNYTKPRIKAAWYKSEGPREE